MERILTENKEKRDDLTAITIAIAAVQGSWNPETKAVVSASMRDQLGLNDQGLNALEKTLMIAVGKMVENLMGEGSMSHVLFGKSIVLSIRDRSLIVLGNMLDVLGSDEAHDWEKAALLTESIKAGTSFEKTVSSLKKGFEKFNTGIMGMLARFAAPGEELDEESDGSSVIRHLEGIYGGSDETLFAKKNSLEEKLMGDIEKRIGSMTAFEIQDKIKSLEIDTDDDMILEPLKMAKEIIKESLKKRSREIETLIETIQ